MNDFFRSKTFKIIAVLLAAVLAFFLRAVYTGGLMPALSHIGGAVATPFGEFFAGIGNGIQDFFVEIEQAPSNINLPKGYKQFQAAAESAKYLLAAKFVK